MSNIQYKDLSPNVIVFSHTDADGIFSAMLIKTMYDNNIIDNNWSRNVHCYLCSYGDEYSSVEWFKQKVEESYVPDRENIVFMTDYSIQPTNGMIIFWNWLTDKDCKFYWIDHHITAIEQLKHLNIPGLQTTKNSGAMNTWNFLFNSDSTDDIPRALQIVNDFDIWNKNSEYSWDKELYPFIYYIESLGMQINDNTGQLVQTIYQLITSDSNHTLLEECIDHGSYIDKFIKNKYNNSLNRIYEFVWNDYKILALNTTYSGSMQFESYEGHADADILLTWYYSGTSYKYGLYTTKPSINVGEISKNYLNGGGHAGAAGGETKEFIFHQLLSNN